MQTMRHLLSTFVLIGLLSLPSPPADALPTVNLPGTSDVVNPSNALSNRRTISPKDAANIARQENGGGRVLAVKLIGEVYRVKLIRDGEVRTVRVPARR